MMQANIKVAWLLTFKINIMHVYMQYDTSSYY